ncbi:helix-turn-helix domain-containing protein [Arachidicoccus ginsenosidivorans]|uniref:Helix-turn-helix domain-containing protein n=1 Tax=Arachidicoccus ginsenosidivorans TaxID=496057 RepID=A0A5B8VKN7_9BACT|nr:XRE family transcriptional regulator [Arachidicoccus ginsenosidivorans]QEC72154.1 helix-turn-helix domain-containing protein [Arachidicoccus ginsenosidivorans]
MADNSLVGDRIRLIRKSQKRTIQEVADTCQLSKSMISKIENNKTMPSVATLVKIATALGTTISSILEQDNSRNTIFTKKKMSLDKLVKTEKGYHIYPFASEFQGKKMQPFLFVARKSEVIAHQLTHEGEEFIYVIEGAMKMQVGDTEYLLTAGDSLYFNALQKHGILPTTEEVRYLDIFL